VIAPSPCSFIEGGRMTTSSFFPFFFFEGDSTFTCVYLKEVGVPHNFFIIIFGFFKM
jgi:hypothetical protein